MTLDIFCVRKNQIYGSEIPQTQLDFEEIKKMNIKVIISLAEEIVGVKSEINFLNDFEHFELFIPDYNTPSKEQVEKFLNIIQNNVKAKKPILVHCLAGCGRTGMMLALAEKIVFGVKDSLKAIENIRKVRPCAVENYDQEQFIINYQK